jgi:hypothetical protein
MFNSGLVIIGIPFKSIQSFSFLLWITGGSLLFFSILLFINEKFIKSKHIINNQKL